MPSEGPFGQATRMRVLEEYLATAGELTAANAWEHVYKCLLWWNQAAGLAHIYDSNHMQPNGGFHSRAVRFTDALCQEWGVTRRELPPLMDRLFRGCVEVLRRTGGATPDPEIESELTGAIERILTAEGLPAARVGPVARQIEVASRDFFTVGNKRKNALGEGFEDLLHILLQRVSRVPPGKIALRQPVSALPGFRRAAPRIRGTRSERQPHPDIAIYENDITHVITTAKWSIRQDRETQFQSEFSSYQRNRTQTTELRFVLITNEFDVARLDNIARASPTGAGGYIFHQIYHISPPLLRITQGDRIGNVGAWLQVGKIGSLEDFLNDMAGRYGVQS